MERLMNREVYEKYNAKIMTLKPGVNENVQDIETECENFKNKVLLAPEK